MDGSSSKKLYARTLHGRLRTKQRPPYCTRKGDIQHFHIPDGMLWGVAFERLCSCVSHFIFHFAPHGNACTNLRQVLGSTPKCVDLSIYLPNPTYCQSENCGHLSLSLYCSFVSTTRLIAMQDVQAWEQAAKKRATAGFRS